MTNEQLLGGIAALVIGNGATAWAIAKWGIARAIAYTHLERDVKELQAFRTSQVETNGRVQNDLKGLSIKIDRKVLDSSTKV